MKVSNVYGSSRSGVNRQATGVFVRGTQCEFNMAAYMSMQKSRNMPLKMTRSVKGKIPVAVAKSEPNGMDEEFLKRFFIFPSGVNYPKITGSPMSSARNYMLHLRRQLDGTRLDRIEINRGFHAVDFGCFNRFLIRSDNGDSYIDDVKDRYYNESWGLDDEWTLDSTVTYYPDIEGNTKEIVRVRFLFGTDFLQPKSSKSAEPFQIVFTPDPLPELKDVESHGYSLARELCPSNCVVDCLGIIPSRERIEWMLSAKSEDLRIRRIVTAARELALHVSDLMMTSPGAVRCGL